MVRDLFGISRDLVAICKVGAVRHATSPTLLIHGDRDPLVPVEHGRDTAEAVPGADLLIIEGMGHQWRIRGGREPEVLPRHFELSFRKAPILLINSAAPPAGR